MDMTKLGRALRLVRFYKWAFGDLTASDSDIGVIGEYLVGDMLGCLPPERKPQAAFDLVTKKGVSIEVKTTTTTVAQGKDRRVYRWYVNDQRTALEGARPLADVWVFMAAKFLEKNRTDIARQLSVFDPKSWICWIATGEQVKASGCRTKISEATFERLGVKSIHFSDFKSEFKQIAKL